MTKTNARNIAISAGVYYCSLWITGPLTWVYWKLLTNRVTYRGEFENAVVMPLVEDLPAVLVAVAVGACIVLLVESKKSVPWAILPAALYAYFGYTGRHWAIQPALSDRIGQALGALFPAIACICGAFVANRNYVALNNNWKWGSGTKSLP